MEKVPTIVTERLRTATVMVAHPDADVLTAFSERTLPERERGPVLDHLARCSQCREVIALALPAEDVAAVVIHPARNAWLTWPRMRWAFMAAGVVAVASVGLVQFGLRSRPATVAHVYVATPTAATQQEPIQPEPQPAGSEAVKVEAKKEAPGLLSSATSSAQPGRDTDREFDRLEKSDELKTSEDMNSVTGSVVRGNTFHGQQLAHGPKPPIQFQQNSNLGANTNNEFNYQAQAAPPPAPALDQQASRQLVLVPAPAPGSTLGGPLNDKQSLEKLAGNDRSATQFQTASASTGAEIARAKPATSANAPQSAPTTEAYAVSADGSNFSPSGSLAPESARWSINSLGGLQRSMDQGRSWQDVDVHAASAVGNSVGLQMAMKSSRAKALAKDKADAKEKPIIFRAVSANGPDVWAGGSEGSLYHSSDSGASWMRVVPSWRGIDLTGDILNLQFSDPQHGRIVTSAAEIWTTADAGQTWDKH